MSGNFATNPSAFFKGGAMIFFDREDADGNSTGERFLGSVKTVGETMTETRIEAKDYAQRVPTVVVSTPEERKLEISLELQESDLDNHALRIAGDVVNATQAATPVTGIAIANVKQGRWYPTGYYNITAVTVTGHTVDVDYKVNAAFGLIFIVPGGGIADDDDLTVDLTPTAQDLNKVTAGTAGVIEGKLVIRSLPASGAQYEASYWRAQMAPDGEFPWVQDGAYGTFKLKATVLNDEANHPGEPYGTIIEINAAA